MITEIVPTPGDPPRSDNINDAIMLLSIVDETQGAALKEWLSQTQETPIPPRKALKPERISKSLPSASLIGVDWENEQPTFRSRIEGRIVAIAFGESRGRSFRETFSPKHLEQVLPAFHEAAHRGRVTLTPVVTKTSNGAPFVYTRLLLPYADETGRVARILAVYGFDTERLATLQEPLDIGDVIPAASARRHKSGNVRQHTG